MQVRHLIAALFGAAAFVAGTPVLAQYNGHPEREDAPIGSIKGVLGHVVCAAAINATGTVAGGTNVVTVGGATGTTRVGVGAYQVAFNDVCGKGPVAAGIMIKGGWFRFVQPDTLTIGNLPMRSCTTADRVGVPTAVFVQCYDANGAPADTSFTIAVMR
jgi:hypothetical protein